MKKKIPLLLTPILFLGLLPSCTDNAKNEDDCIAFKNEYVTSVNSPSTGLVTESILMEVSFFVYNGCGGFGNFIETQNGNTRTIEAEAKYEGCICTQDIPLRTANYEFSANRTGDYVLNFKSSPTDFIEVNLTIN